MEDGHYLVQIIVRTCGYGKKLHILEVWCDGGDERHDGGQEVSACEPSIMVRGDLGGLFGAEDSGLEFRSALES